MLVKLLVFFLKFLCSVLLQTHCPYVRHEVPHRAAQTCQLVKSMFFCFLKSIDVVICFNKTINVSFIVSKTVIFRLIDYST